MLRILGKTLGRAIAVLWLVSTLAVATEMTCAKDDGKGTCIAATGSENEEEGAPSRRLPCKFDHSIDQRL